MTGRRADHSRFSGRARATVALAGVVAVGAGLGAQGTLAYFTDSATATVGSIQAGTLDMTVNSQLSGNGGTTVLSLTAPNLLPGESVAASFPIANEGTSPLTFTLAATGSGGLAVTNGLQYSITYGGSAATNSGTEAAGNRSGSCGTASSDTNTTVLNSTARDLGTGTRTLTAGQSQTACIVVRLNSTAGNALQGLSGAATFVFSAKQPGA